LLDIAEGRLVPRPDFQRRLVWSNKHRNAFIRTVLEDLPFPEIYVAAGNVNDETAESTELLVDGQQRMTTLDQYFRGSPELKLDKQTKPYAELSKEQKSSFLEYEVVVRDLGPAPLDQIKEVFKRINSTSYALNAMEINNARFDGDLKEFCVKIAEDPFFEKYHVFSANDGRRMNDAGYCLGLISTLLSTYFNRDEAFEDYLRKYNEDFPHRARLAEEISAVFNLIDDCGLHRNSRAFQKSDLFTLVVELHRILFRDGISLNGPELGRILSSFYEEVEAVGETQTGKPYIVEYHEKALQASNDRGNRIARGRILRFAILGESPGPGDTLRDRVVERDHQTCQNCGRLLEGNEIEFDQMVPLSQGGGFEEANLRVVCRQCHQARHKPPQT
jgi:hypothetical protein